VGCRQATVCCAADDDKSKVAKLNMTLFVDEDIDLWISSRRLSGSEVFYDRKMETDVFDVSVNNLLCV
jgi:hypothetical protein